MTAADGGAAAARRNLDPVSAASLARHDDHHATYVADSGLTAVEYDASSLPFRVVAGEAARTEELVAGGDAAAVQLAGDTAAETYHDAADDAEAAGLPVGAAIAAGLAAAAAHTLGRLHGRTTHRPQTRPTSRGHGAPSVTVDDAHVTRRWSFGGGLRRLCAWLGPRRAAEMGGPGTGQSDDDTSVTPRSSASSADAADALGAASTTEDGAHPDDDDDPPPLEAPPDDDGLPGLIDDGLPGHIPYQLGRVWREVIDTAEAPLSPTRRRLPSRVTAASQGSAGKLLPAPRRRARRRRPNDLRHRHDA
jgi:hypothetical protein